MKLMLYYAIYQVDITVRLVQNMQYKHARHTDIRVSFASVRYGVGLCVGKCIEPFTSETLPTEKIDEMHL
jgi:hypothetical protein